MDNAEEEYIKANKKTPRTLDTMLYENGVLVSPQAYGALKNQRPTPEYVAKAFARRERLTNASPKFTDVVGDFTADLTAASASQPITVDMTGLIQRGYNSYGQFTGDQIEPIMHSIRFQLSMGTVPDTSTQGVMLWLFQYHGPIIVGANGVLTAPLPILFLNTYIKPATGLIDPLSYMLSNKNRVTGNHITTIWRRWFAFNSAYLQSTDMIFQEIQADLIDKCRAIRFRDIATGNIDPVDGAILLMIQDTRGATTAKTATKVVMSNRLVYGQ